MNTVALVQLSLRVVISHPENIGAEELGAILEGMEIPTITIDSPNVKIKEVDVIVDGGFEVDIEGA